MKLPPLPPVYLLVGLGSIAGLRRFLPALNVLPAPVPHIGAGIAALGALVALTGVVTLLRHRTTVTFAHSSALVTNGIFRRTRNPIYLGLLLMLCGAALFSENSVALLVPLAVYAALTAHFIPLEEAKTAQELGDAYLRYKERTPRWF